MDRKAWLIGILLAYCATAGADRLLIEKVEATRDMNLPRHGLTMDAVESRYGEPDNRMPSVGEPPITRWIYPEFTVYFEHRHVIDTVAHVQTANADTDSR